MQLILRLSLLAGLAACAPLPGSDPAQTLRGPDAAPPLLPLDQLVAEAGTPRIGPEVTGSVEARAAALRARAKALQATPLPSGG
ncbi:hypothetical protein C5F48_06155 [Cereibacter changlensis JA139]|uniref:DUF3035 domain-containing protein n=2 Tax=Cereibacter changlensis TaxID=402884 RepID=A0A2T4JXU5_9RHOB|nr:hypothetical protein [Cereibacter changlensis]PTE22617.1 hypothetical protein C5F48_06155 [Cereibacter changlensis JA139]PZX53773.1 hypothetical protein LX76_02414 [Cereibacter changlensis]